MQFAVTYGAKYYKKEAILHRLVLSQSLCAGCFLGHVPGTVVQCLRRRFRQPAQTPHLQPAAAERQERAEQDREEQQEWRPEESAEGS